MKKFYAVFISFSMFCTSFPPHVFSQELNLNRASGQPKMSDYFSSLNYVDKIDVQVKTQMLQKRMELAALMQEVEDALKKENAAAFYLAVNSLNTYLLNDYISGDINDRYAALTALTEHIKNGLINPADLEKAFDAFENTLTTQLKCSSLYCEILGLSAMGLALSHDAGKVLILPADREGTKLTDRQRRILLLNSLIKNDYGSMQANQIMGTYLLRAAAYLDGLKSVQNMTGQIIENGKESWGRSHLNKYDLNNYELQKSAMKVLSELGPVAKPALIDYAVNRRSLASQLHAEIELAYLPLTPEEDARNKKALELYYCHRDFKLDSKHDLALKQEIAYAYGRGRKMEYVVETGSQKCLVTYPTTPDSRIVAKEWTDIAMKEVIFLGATMGVGPLLSSMKNGVRVLKHIKAIRFAAKRQNKSLYAFFRKGSVTLPKFNAPVKAATELKTAAAVVPAKAAEEAATAAKAVKPAPAVSKPVVPVAAPAKAAPTADATESLETLLAKYPKKNPRTGRYPSGLRDEQWVTREWLEYYKNGYFKPRDQIEAIEGMTAAKMNNVMEHLFYMNMETAEKVILDPIRRTGKLPLFMYDDKLIPGTRRLSAGYYKYKFNQNVKRFVDFAAEDGSIYKHNVALTDIAISMKDYTFAQGFAFPNNPAMSHELAKNWAHLVEEITSKGVNANRAKINHLWTRPIAFDEGKAVSLKEYFTQTRTTAFFKEKAPDFYLNSPKWVALENERRNLAAADYVRKLGMKNTESFTDKIQNFFILGNRKNYLSLDEYSNIMYHQYRSNPKVQRVLGKWSEYDAPPSSLTFREICHEGRACQMAITDGGASVLRPGYDGTRLRDRFIIKPQQDVKVVVFDNKDGAAKVVKLKEVISVEDLRPADFDLIEAGAMLADRLDDTWDLLSVQRAERAMRKLPHLKATIYPKPRLPQYETLPESLTGGGMNAYLSLFKHEFYPVETIYRVRFNGWKPYLKPEYYIRKEVPALSGTVYRQDLTFIDQVLDRIVK